MNERNQNAYRESMDAQAPSDASLERLRGAFQKPPHKKTDRVLVRVAALAAAFLFCVGGVFAAFIALRPQTAPAGETGSYAQTGSYTQIYDFLEHAAKKSKEAKLMNGIASFFQGGSTKGQSADLAEGSNAVMEDSAKAYGLDTTAKGSDYSGTNLQVEGVQEADIVKCDGEFFYFINNRHLRILRAENGALTQCASLALTDMSAHHVYDLYINKDRLILLTQAYSETKSVLKITFFDVSDRYAPVELSGLEQDGSLLSSRMVGDTLYPVTSHTVFAEAAQKDKPETYIPCYGDGDGTVPIAEEDIYFCEPAVPDIYAYYNYSESYLLLSGIDTNKGAFVSQKSLFGFGTELYASPENLYVIVQTGENTELMRFSLSAGVVELAAQGGITGRVINQFCMDEHQGFFRIVTTSGAPAHNALYCLDSALNIVGSVAGLAPDERIYSARFLGDIAYFVTFRETDPLFSVDVSDPTAPKLLGALKIPGFSTYLHPWSDSLLFGFGQENTGRETQLKLSMFNIANPADVTEENRSLLSAGNRGYLYSEALYNHKAILVAPNKNLIAFGTTAGVLVFSYDSDGFTLRKTLDADGKLAEQDGVRVFYIGEYLYAVSPSSGAFSYRLDTLEAVQSIPFAPAEGGGVRIYDVPFAVPGQPEPEPEIVEPAKTEGVPFERTQSSNDIIGSSGRASPSES